MRMQTLGISGLIWGLLATAVGVANVHTEDGRSMDQISQEEVRAAVRATVEKQMQGR